LQLIGITLGSQERNSNQPLLHILVGYNSNEVQILGHQRKVDLLPITPVTDLIIASGEGVHYMLASQIKLLKIF